MVRKSIGQVPGSAWPIRPLVLACVILLLACEVGSTGTDPAEVELLRASRERWDREGLTRYRYTLELHAMIVGGSPIAVEVRDDAPVSVRYVDGAAAGPEASFIARFDTVEELFGVIEEQLEQGADRIAAAYDPALGYPVSAEIDPEENAIDDEFSFQVSGFEALR